MSDCKHNWSGVLHCTECGAEKGIGELQAEIERLKALLKDAALYLDMGDHGYPKSINPDGVFHHKFKHYSKVES